MSKHTQYNNDVILPKLIPKINVNFNQIPSVLLCNFKR